MGVQSHPDKLIVGNSISNISVVPTRHVRAYSLAISLRTTWESGYGLGSCYLEFLMALINNKMKIVHASLSDYIIVYIILSSSHAHRSVHHTHTFTSRDSSSCHSELKKGCKNSQSSWGLTSTATREILPLKSNPFRTGLGYPTSQFIRWQ